MPCRRYYISGRVQGVFYRASTCEKARALGLDGYARNLDDGRVEVCASGPAQALGELQSWLWEGPPQARVDEVEVEDGAEPGIRRGFRVR